MMRGQAATGTSSRWRGELRRWSRTLAILLLLATSLAERALADDRFVLVPPFENMTETKARVTYELPDGSDEPVASRSYQIDRYSHAPRSILEDILTRVSGIRVVERQRLDMVLSQLELPFETGRYDSTTALKIGNLLGASTLILGTVESISSDISTLNAYGVRATTTVVKASLRVRVIDIESRAVTYSQRIMGSATFSKSQFGGTANSDVAFQVMDDALTKLAADREFMRAIGGSATGTASRAVPVEFKPTPGGSDVIVEGVYRGGSPLTLELPAGKPVLVSIRKQGFEVWEETIQPFRGLVVSPELARRPSVSAR